MTNLFVHLGVIVGLLLPIPLLAHSSHSHYAAKPVSAEVAQTNAKKNILKLISDKKLDASWKEAKQIDVRQKKFGDRMEWMVTFENKSTKDAKKQKLYIFMTLAGHYIAANHTGK